LPKWSLPYRLKLYGNIFVSQIPTLIPGIKVEFSHSFKKEQQEKSHKTGWILVCSAQINRFSKFLFLGKLLIWLTKFIVF